MTASWVRAKAGKGKGAKQDETPDKQIELCDFYEVGWMGDTGWNRMGSFIKGTTSNSNQPTPPILFPMASIPWPISRIIARKCDSVLITWSDAWYVEDGLFFCGIVTHGSC